MGWRLSPRVWVGPAAGLAAWVLCGPVLGLGGNAALAVAITAWTAAWWIAEPIPPGAVALLPLSVFPVAGILTHEQVAAAVGNKLVMLLLGGFLLSTAIEASGAHRRLAMGMLRVIGGGGPRRVVLGFMIAAAALSMWVSNTATCLMLLPVALAVAGRDASGKLAVPLLLGLAYGANIGGMGTPVGTPPNPVTMAAYEGFLAAPENAGFVGRTGARPLTFAGWMARALPVVAVLLPAAWLILTRRLGGTGPLTFPDPGAWTRREVRVLAVFGCVIAAWVTRTDPFGGWSAWLGLPGAWDSDVAFLGLLAMLLVPDGEGGRLLGWAEARKIPWDLILLLAGGIAISTAFASSGVSEAIAGGLAGIPAVHPLAVNLGVVAATAAVTELINNTAAAVLVMPLLGAAAMDFGVSPLPLMLGAAFASSCAFMLPIATAPNAVVYGSGKIGVRRMAAEGLLVNAAAILAISVYAWVLGLIGG